MVKLDIGGSLGNTLRDLNHNSMWTKWQASHSLLIWITLQVLCTAVSGLRHKTACYNFLLMVDPPCAATEMLLPTKFTLGVSSDVTCHSEITGTSLRQKGVDEIRRCCQQRENDTVTDYCLPAMKNQLPGHYYLDFVNTCTAATKCQLSTPGGTVQHTAGEDYVTFTFECVHKDTVMHIQHDSTHTGQEVYLYNDQHDGAAHANCLAYSNECNSHVIIQLAATRVVSPACSVNFTDGAVSTKVDCKNPPASRNCSSAMFESKSNYVNMSIFMTVGPGRQEKEFLWLLAKADTGKNVTVVCGANIPADVSLNCSTSVSTTTASTTSTTAATTATTTTQTVTSNNAFSNHAQVAVTSSPGQPQAQPSKSTAAGTTMHNNDSVITPRQSNPNSPTTLVQQSGVTETTSEAVIIGSSVGGVIMIAVIVTLTVCV
ncbi:serine-rich adhesin for platelets-like [Haliotis cracherodii]|uniref:serine-rich adhesin for platelets-like n=1 Tax=Haliotis cracherodii TaxID=6455 RepID=UPI0039E7C03E